MPQEGLALCAKIRGLEGGVRWLYPKLISA
jgi:hypothetical protein